MYEFELVQKEHRKSIVITVITILAIVGLLFLGGILWGLNKIENYDTFYFRKTKQEQECSFCMKARDLHLENSSTSDNSQFSSSKEHNLSNVKIQLHYRIPSCVSNASSYVFYIQLNMNETVPVKSLILYTPSEYKLISALDQFGGVNYKIETELTLAGKTNYILINKTVKLLHIRINNQFYRPGNYNMILMIETPSSKRRTIATIPIVVKKQCKDVEVPLITPSLYYKQVENLPTPTPSQEQEIITPTEQAPITTPVPNTGIVDNIAYFTIGIVIGIVILSIKKIKFINFNSVNKFIFNVYATAEDLFARTFSSKVYKEKKILDKVLSKSTNKKKSSSPK